MFFSFSTMVRIQTVAVVFIFFIIMYCDLSMWVISKFSAFHQCMEAKLNTTWFYYELPILLYSIADI